MRPQISAVFSSVLRSRSEDSRLGSGFIERDRISGERFKFGAAAGEGTAGGGNHAGAVPLLPNGAATAKEPGGGNRQGSGIVRGWVVVVMAR